MCIYKDIHKHKTTPLLDPKTYTLPPLLQNNGCVYNDSFYLVLKLCTGHNDSAALLPSPRHIDPKINRAKISGIRGRDSPWGSNHYGRRNSPGRMTNLATNKHRYKNALPSPVFASGSKKISRETRVGEPHLPLESSRKEGEAHWIAAEKNSAATNEASNYQNTPNWH